jgi:hypothetical protein
VCCACRFYYQPENQDDVVAIVADCARAKRRLRVLGSGLSPNGVGFSEEGMMSMALLDRVLWVDPDSMRVSCYVSWMVTFHVLHQHVVVLAVPCCVSGELTAENRMPGRTLQAQFC